MRDRQEHRAQRRRHDVRAHRRRRRHLEQPHALAGRRRPRRSARTSVRRCSIRLRSRRAIPERRRALPLDVPLVPASEALAARDVRHGPVRSGLVHRVGRPVHPEDVHVTPRRRGTLPRRDDPAGRRRAERDRSRPFARASSAASLATTRRRARAPAPATSRAIRGRPSPPCRCRRAAARRGPTSASACRPPRFPRPSRAT